jgi:hypothetical protein
MLSIFGTSFFNVSCLILYFISYYFVILDHEGVTFVILYSWPSSEVH